MADNNSNMIKPVEGLQNVAGLTPAKRREQGKRQQDTHEEKEQEPKQDMQDINELFDDVQPVNGESTENEENRHTIDYRA